MKKKLSISLLPGDGIGQEISIEAKKILNWIDQNTELELDCFEELVGGASIDKHQTPLHDKTLEIVASKGKEKICEIQADPTD